MIYWNKKLVYKHMNNATVDWTRFQILLLLPKRCRGSWFIWNSEILFSLLTLVGENILFWHSVGFWENAISTKNASIPNECPLCIYSAKEIIRKYPKYSFHCQFQNNRLIHCTTKSSWINQRTIFLRWAHFNCEWHKNRCRHLLTRENRYHN